MISAPRLDGTLVAAVLTFARVSVTSDRADEIASASEDLFAEVNRVSAFMAARREVGMSLEFSHRQDGGKGS